MGKRLYAFIIILLLASLTSATSTYDPILKLKKMTACLMYLVDQVSGPVVLAFFVVGGITYISAVSDSKQRIMGKKYLLMGLTGILTIKVIIAIAAQPPFNVPLTECPQYPTTTTTTTTTTVTTTTVTTTTVTTTTLPPAPPATCTVFGGGCIGRGMSPITGTCFLSCTIWETYSGMAKCWADWSAPSCCCCC